jgi:archaeosortase B (VPXXXP-CTERM-specific)
MLIKFNIIANTEKYMRIKKGEVIKPEIRFIFAFLFLISVFFVLYDYTLDSFAFLKADIANVLAFTLSMLGIKSTVQGEDVLLGNFSLKIVEECTAVFASLIYVSCVLAYPTSLKNKLVGIGFGIPVIQVVNLARLVVLSFTALYYPGIFEFVHTYIWQSIFIIFVIVIWLIWLERFVK